MLGCAAGVTLLVAHALQASSHKFGPSPKDLHPLTSNPDFALGKLKEDELQSPFAQFKILSDAKRTLRKLERSQMFLGWVWLSARRFVPSVFPVQSMYTSNQDNQVQLKCKLQYPAQVICTKTLVHFTKIDVVCKMGVCASVF